MAKSVHLFTKNYEIIKLRNKIRNMYIIERKIEFNLHVPY